MARREIRIGTAGWTIPRQHADEFPGDGRHLERYARRFSAAEINSSFHRPHRPATYARWAASVPPDFRFAVKLPREITHTRKLVDVEEPLERFLGEAAGLDDRLGPILVQLPPSLNFEPGAVSAFLRLLRARHAGQVVCEPRHPSWFADEPDAMLRRFKVARVAADPAPAAGAGVPGGWSGLIYRRLHGAPRVYYSAYETEYLAATAGAMIDVADTAESWCIFDNTASGAATGNALWLMTDIAKQG